MPKIEIDKKEGLKKPVILPSFDEYLKNRDSMTNEESDIVLGLICRSVVLNFQAIHKVYAHSDNVVFKKMVEDLNGVFPIHVEDLNILVSKLAGELDVYYKMREQHTIGKYC